MPILGYCNPMSVAPGELVSFYVSSENDQPYRATIVRLINADTDPRGPGFKSEPVETAADGEYPGRKQAIHPGSYAVVADHPLLAGTDGFSLQALIYPTKPGGSAQGIITKWSANPEAGYGLFIDDDGCLVVYIGDGLGRTEKLTSGRPLLPRCWYFAAASFDRGGHRLCLHQEPIVGRANGLMSLPYELEKTTASVERRTDVTPGPTPHLPLLIAAYVEKWVEEDVQVTGHFNGKIDRPRAADLALSRERMIAATEPPWV